jgi:hypothetical protein
MYAHGFKPSKNMQQKKNSPQDHVRASSIQYLTSVRITALLQMICTTTTQITDTG